MSAWKKKETFTLSNSMQVPFEEFGRVLALQVHVGTLIFPASQ
jgi:hypothetical protein